MSQVQLGNGVTLGQPNYRMIQLITEVPLPEFEIKDRKRPYDFYLEWYRLLVQKEPTDFHRYCYIKALCADMQLDRALHYLKQCDPDKPITQFFRSFVLLHKGEFPEGFRLRESRFIAAKYPLNSLAPQWDGKPTDKKLIIWQEGGFGDVVQYSRYLPQVLKLAPNASVVIDSQLYPFLKYNFADTMQDFNPYEFQLQCGFMSLPYLLNDFEIKTEPYLKVPDAVVKKWAQYAGRTGFLGKGNPAHSSDKLRSLTPEEIGRFIGDKNWVSLEPQITGAQDWMDTAGIIANLKLLVTVDTASAHIAGALDKSVWVLMNKHHDWRWSHQWYNSMRVFKCKEHSDWEPVFLAIERELRHVEAIESGTAVSGTFDIPSMGRNESLGNVRDGGQLPQLVDRN